MQTESEGQVMCLCRSILYEAISIGFQWPTPLIFERLASESGVLALADAAERVDTSLVEPVLSLGNSEASPDDLETEFRDLFGHTVRTSAAPYETEYGTEGLFRQPQEMSDIGAFMSAFGVALRPHGHERVDHISCECEFMAFLCRKESYALGVDDEVTLVETRQAQRLFLKDHLGRFARAFTRKVLDGTTSKFYGGLANLCRVVVVTECRRFGVGTGPESLALSDFTPDDLPATCGAGPELIDIETAAGQREAG